MEIYSKYDVSGRLQNGSAGVPRITIENVSEESKVESTKKATRENRNDDSALKIKTIGENLKTDAKLNESMEDQSEGDKQQSSISKENGKRRWEKIKRQQKRSHYPCKSRKGIQTNQIKKGKI